MADRRVDQLSALTGANTDDADLYVVEDVSDTTESASGSLKKQTRAEARAAITKAPTQQVLTVGSGTYTTPAGCKAILVEVIAAGGGGGGVSGSATLAGAGSGGGSGGYARKLYTAPAGSYTYTVGAKGAGGAAGSPGGSGNDSTFNNAGTVVTAKGGVGGNEGILGSTAIASMMRPPGVGGAISTNGDVNAGGQDGHVSWRTSATVAFGGTGGPGPFGGGGSGANVNAAGVAGRGPGAGGGGGCVASVNTGRAGGDGADGVIIVTEFY